MEAAAASSLCSLSQFYVFLVDMISCYSNLVPLYRSKRIGQFGLSGFERYTAISMKQSRPISSLPSVS